MKNFIKMVNFKQNKQTNKQTQKQKKNQNQNKKKKKEEKPPKSEYFFLNSLNWLFIHRNRAEFCSTFA